MYLMPLANEFPNKDIFPETRYFSQCKGHPFVSFMQGGGFDCSLRIPLVFEYKGKETNEAMFCRSLKFLYVAQDHHNIKHNGSILCDV